MNIFYTALFYAGYTALAIICMMMMTLFVSILASIKTGFSGKFILHRKHPIYIMRYAMMFPQALFLAVFFRNMLDKDLTSAGVYEPYYSRWQITKNLCHDYVLRELNLCKIFWSQLISIVLFMPINLAILAVAVPIFAVVTPPALIVFGIIKLFTLGIIPLVIMFGAGIKWVFKGIGKIIRMILVNPIVRWMDTLEKRSIDKHRAKHKAHYENMDRDKKFLNDAGLKPINNMDDWNTQGGFYENFDRFLKMLDALRLIQATTAKQRKEVVEKFRKDCYNATASDLVRSYIKELVKWDDFKLIVNGNIGKTSFEKLQELVDAHKVHQAELTAEARRINAEWKERSEKYYALLKERRIRAEENRVKWEKRWAFFRDVIYRKVLCPTFEYVEDTKEEKE